MNSINPTPTRPQPYIDPDLLGRCVVCEFDQYALYEDAIRQPVRGVWYGQAAANLLLTCLRNCATYPAGEQAMHG